ncbi:MAG: MFS transporter, partial [Pedobacter sp.]
VIFGAWSDRVGRKWIMLSGMLLGIIFYRPIYQTFLDDTSVENYDKIPVLSAAANSAKLTPISDMGDSLRTIETHVKLANGMQFTKVQTDTISAIKGISPSMEMVKDKVLPTPIFWKFVGLIFFQILLVTMVYGPIAAFLVELFPTKIRYTSMSLPYHIGNGVFGGLVPFIATLIASFAGSTPLSGLWYPIGIATLSLIIGTIYLSNKADESIND